MKGEKGVILSERPWVFCVWLYIIVCLSWAPGWRSQTDVQTYATKFWHTRLFRPKLGMSRLWRPKLGIFRLPRPWWSVATFATKADTTRPCGSGNSVTGATNLANSRLSRPKWRRRNFPDQHGDGTTSKKIQGFRDRGGDGATFATKVDTARLRKRPDRPGRRDQKVHFPHFRDFQIEAETARLSRPRWRLCAQSRKLDKTARKMMFNSSSRQYRHSSSLIYKISQKLT